MTRGNHPVGIPGRSDVDSGDPLWINCYVRPNVSQAGLRRIDAIRERLERLAETALVAGYEFRQWPPKHDAGLGHAHSDRTREELLTEFEQWAQRHGCGLTPAFQRRQVSPSVLGPDEPREEVRVPTVTFVLSRESDNGNTTRGVVPYRTDSGSDDGRTYTVDDWLSIAEETVTPAIARGVHGLRTDVGNRESSVQERETGTRSQR
ncbi:MAG: hypothetical protein ACI8XM_001362 [Haloarculaceae archaeon]|jgi:hypothetical protein